MRTVSINGSLLGALLCVVSSTSAFVAPRPSNFMHRQRATVAPRPVETQLNARTLELIIKYS
jgi:hypothetical protein